MGYSKNDQKPYHHQIKIDELLNENINRFDQKACSLKKLEELMKENITRFAHEDATATRFKEFITNEMNGYDIELVSKRKLYADHLLINHNPSRLSMPLETHEFLEESERRDMENVKEFEVRLLGPRLKMHEKPMVIKMWRLKGTNRHVFKCNWYEFLKENDEVLKKNPMIHLWSFRRDGRHCFALACIDDFS